MVAPRLVRGMLLLGVAVLAGMLGVPSPAWGVHPIKGGGKATAGDETVELFAGMADGKLEAKVVAKDATECRLMVTNKSNQPLNISLPEALAAAPVLAQFNFPGNRNQGQMPFNQNQNQMPFGQNQGNNPGQAGQLPQILGLAMPPSSRQNAPIGAMFNVAPEKVLSVKLSAVCLEHGKPEPKPQVAYEIKPLEEVTKNPGVRELCGMLARGEVSREAAQAAAWHLNNDMSWDALKKERIKIVFAGTSEPTFTKCQLDEGRKAAEKALAMSKVAHPDASSTASAK
jgi:hypothetical protein